MTLVWYLFDEVTNFKMMSRYIKSFLAAGCGWRKHTDDLHQTWDEFDVELPVWLVGGPRFKF